MSRNINSIHYLFYLVIASALSSCMSSANISVLQPADINVPQHIQKITVANRSIAGKGSQLNNVVEGILTGEGIGQDKRSSADAILGVISGLSNSPRFVVSQAANTDLKGTGTTQIPTPLNWQEVENICRNNNADALLLLEVFDSDSRQTFSTKPASKTVNGQKVEFIQHMATAKMIVTTNWRLYDPVNRTIIDDNKAEDFKEFNGVGENQQMAISNLPPKERSIKETGFFAGEQYADRIAPNWIWVSRSYYTKGSPEFKTAKLFARSNQWKDAAAIWKPLAEASPNPKVKQRATYNMALACEIEGNLTAAVEWAKKSLKSGNKKAVYYINMLNDRIADQARMEQQMGN